MSTEAINGFQLSPQQARLWRLRAGEPGSPYFVQCALEITGPVAAAALRGAVDRVVARHEILRTSFPRVPGLSLPLQEIGDSGSGSGAVWVDLPGAPVESLFTRMAAEPLDLGGRPLKAALVPMGNGAHALLLRLPALCADAVSLERLAVEVSREHAAALGGPEPEGEPMQYADIAQWLNELSESEETQDGREFWRRQDLAGHLGLALPGASSRPGSPFSPGVERTRAGAGLVQGLRQAAAPADASLAEVLLASWAVLLWRLCGEEESLAVGLACEGRSYEGLEDAIGPLSRLLPLRCAPRAGQPFAELLAAVAGVAREAQGWQEFFTWSGLDTSSGEPPFCAAAFDFTVRPRPWEAGGVTWAQVRSYTCDDRYEVRLSCVEEGDGVVLELHHDTSRLSADEARRFLDRLLALLAGVAADPSTAVGELAVLDEAERRRVVTEVNVTPEGPAPDTTLHALIEEQAARHPGAPAVVYEDQQLTYAELNHRANQLARHLRVLGVEPEVPVGIALDRSVDVVVSLLAVLKAGGAYLPLDVTLPRERLAFMLADTGTPVVLTHAALAGSVSLEGVAPVLVDEPDAWAGASGEDLPGGAAPENAAYVLFTSGSTGNPKGVVVEHRQIVNYVHGAVRRLELPDSPRFALVSTFAADLGNTALYGALCTGGCVHVISQERAADPEGLADYFNDHAIDSLKIVPSHLAVLRTSSRPGGALPRKRLVLGGEASSWDWVEEMRALAPECLIFNHYGPTEATVGVLVYRAGERPADGAGNLPLGQPLANSRVYVLDPRFQPRPAGVPGELYIGGAGVARAYLGRPDLTAARFVPDPFSAEPGRRLYRTGDLARLLPGGDFEFLGRVDDQVKIRGFRIEPGEVAAVLRQHPGVREAAVVAREDEPGQKRLVAYLAADRQGPRAKELRDFLLARLPEFMVPSAFVTLPALPLTPNGKVDRRALPAPDSGRARVEEELVAPETPRERELAEIWAEVLGVDQVGVHDNFFQLGGDSIRSIEVRAKALDRGLDFSVAQLFQAPTIRELAQLLEEGQGEAAASYEPFSLVAAEDRGKLPAGVLDAFPLSMLQQGMLFHSVYSAGSSTYHDIGSYRIRCAFGPEALGAAVRTLVERHPALRTSFHLTGFSEPLQLLHPAAEAPLAVEDLRALSEAERERAVDAFLEEETRRGFEWTRAPLLRFYLHRLTGELLQLTVSFHHAILDGWSRHSMVTELLQQYLLNMGLEARPIPPAPSLSYGEFVKLEREALASEEHRRFWQVRLDGSSLARVPRWSAGYPEEGAEEGPEAHIIVRNLPEELSDGLKDLSRRTEAPLKTVLLAVHFRVLALLSGQSDLMTGLIANGRPEVANGERVLGLFLNSIPLRVQLRGGTWIDLVRGVLAAEQETLSFRRYPLAALQRGSSEPLFETAFNYMHYHIYQNVIGLKDLEVVGYKGFQETNIPLCTNFYQDPVRTVLQLGLEYDANTVRKEQIEALFGYFHSTIGAMVRDPESRYDLHSPLAWSERQQILGEWNDTGAPVPADRCFHQLFAEQVALRPDATALVFGGRRLTFAELDARANQVANRLRSLGAGPESRIALCGERSAETLIGLLGIFKASAAYVPLDPGYPEERLRFMIEDSCPAALLTQHGLLAGLAGAEVKVVCFDADREALEGESRQAPPDLATARNLAYVIYTSGSTGRPKGVLIEHRGLANLAAAQQLLFGVQPGSRLLQFASLSFDASIFEIAMAWLAGGELHLGTREDLLPGAPLRKLLLEGGVQAATLTPSALAALNPEDLPGLELVVAAGEALPPALASRWAAGRRLFNAYGPTEATVWATAALVAPGGGRPAIGRAIANQKVYVLDAFLQPMPVTVPGHLHLGGAGLARGYQDRPDLTAERFVPDPFSGEPGSRLYRTGDLVRFLPGGEIEFLGRIDHQVKVRGLRIELGEIEALLGSHPQVREAVAVVREDAPGERALVAYVVPAAGGLEISGVRDFLRGRLPEFMVPAAFVVLEALPLTPNGKVDRRALPRPEGDRQGLASAYEAPRNEIERVLAGIWQEVLRLEKVGVHDNFFDLGGHSLPMVQIHARVREALHRDVPIVDMFRFPTVASLARHLSAGEEMPAAALAGRRAEARRLPAAGGSQEIAIVGMAGRFPGAGSVGELWRNVCQGIESVVWFSDEELAAAGVSRSQLADPSYVKGRPALDGIELFDAPFFGFSPREAEVLDPQQRFFLECAWEALESAGYDPEVYPGSIGVYAGGGLSSYLFLLYSNLGLLETVGGQQVLLGNDKDYLATRVSYKLNLRGPSLTVQTACSTSLVAVHLACQSLARGECDMALAGGVKIAVPQRVGYPYQEGGIHSPDGHCRPFDAAAQGTIGGNGVGVVVLKRLADALADGDTIHAVIKGSAMNNDGSQRVGFTAPGVDGQAQVVAEALLVSGVPAETIGYVEAHGTGTPLGDPIEIAALTQAYRVQTQGRGFCAVGSLKANIGHLDAAAGVAGLIKATLAVEHGALPPSINFEQPNPKIDFTASPFYVNTALAPWPAAGSPRRAGVSSLGMGGTNVHVVLEEAPAPAPTGPARPAQLLLLSARTSAALEAASTRLAAHLEAHPDEDLADVAYTLQAGRKRFSHRRALVCRDRAEALELLGGGDSKRVWTASEERTGRPVAFLFPGQGAQYPDMGLGLYRSEAVFREEVDRCAGLLVPHLGFDLREVLYPAAGAEEEAARRLEQTAVTQPALFAVEHATARLLLSWGIRPQALLGHSIGEYVAACLTGVISLEDALALVAARGRLVQQLPAGAMLAVSLPAREAEELAAGRLSLAAVNAPGLCVLAGTPAAVEEVRAELEGREIEVRGLHTSHAFHSAMMEPVLAPFAELVSRVELRPPAMRWISNVTGTWITPEEATDPGYWVRHLRQTVRFADGVAELLRDEDLVLLEVGPGRTLSTFVRQQGQQPGRPAALTTLRHPREEQDDLDFLLTALGRLWLAGATVDWQAFHAGSPRRRLPLPTYPFERQRYWVEAGRPAETLRDRTGLDRRPDVADWFSVPSWSRRTPAARRPAEPGETWLVLTDSQGLGAEVAQRLATEGLRVVTAVPEPGFAKLEREEYVLPPGERPAFEALARDLAASGQGLAGVVHAWTLGLVPDAQARGCDSLLLLIQELRRAGISGPLRLVAVADGLVAVVHGEAVSPEKAPLLALCRVLPQEDPGLSCRALDVALPSPGNRRLADLAARLADDVLSGSDDPLVAWRGAQRWVRDFEPLILDRKAPPLRSLRDGGVYLLTGALAGPVLGLAEHFARTHRARLALAQVPQGTGKEEAVRDLEALGAEVFSADVDPRDGAGLAAFVAEAEQRFGGLHGVFAAGVAAGAPGLLPAAELDPRVVATAVRNTDGILAALAGAIGERELDFCLVLSSTASLLGGVGGLAQSAAYLYADAFATGWEHTGRTPWTVMNCHPGGEGRFAVSPAELLDASLRVVELCGEPQVAVSPVDLAALEARVRQATAPGAGDSRPAGHARPDLQQAYVAPRNETERIVAAIWQDLLGIDRVGVNDNFFELGGHSLLATRLTSRLRDAFQVEIPLRNVFEAVTVADSAAMIVDHQVRQADAAALEEILAEIRQLGGEEMQAVLAAERQSIKEEILNE